MWHLYLKLGCLFIMVRSLELLVPQLGSWYHQKTLELRRKVQRLCFVAFGMKVIEFQSFYELEKIENCFYFSFILYTMGH